VSTVLDVAVCLLLVSVAVATLTAAVPSEERPGDIDEGSAMDSLSTITATVPAGGGRSVHGTLAEHLAVATLVGARLDGSRLTESPYPAAVRGAIDDGVGADRIHVTTRWSPYPDAALESTLALGTEPPPSASTTAKKRTVDSGIGSPTAEPIGSFDAIATAIAAAFIERLFPPDRVRVQLADPRTASETAARYRTVADAVGIEGGIEHAIADASAERANRRLSAALAARLKADLRASYGTPEAAAADLEPGRIEIVVRRWEP
jgi:hypothetical protein